MTHQEKLEAIRKACVKANPDKCIVVTTKDLSGAVFEPGRVIDVPGIVVPIRLADVAFLFSVSSAIHDDDLNDWMLMLIKKWNLRKDSIEEQSEETVAFIYDLLK